MISFFLNLLKISFVVSLAVLIVIVVSPITQKKYTNAWRYWLWMVLCILLVFPLNITSPYTIIKISSNKVQEFNESNTIQSEEFINPFSTEIGVSFGDALDAKQMPHKEPKFMMSLNMLLLFWCIGAALFFAYNIGVYHRYKKNIDRWCYKPTDTLMINLFEKIKERMGISSTIQLKICSTVNSPMLIGLTKPMVLLPDHKFKSNELSHIFSHELMHYKRYDLAYKLFLLIVKSLHWFNPMIYIMTKMALSDLEVCCDAYVIKKYNRESIRDYTITILNVMKLNHTQEGVLTTNFNGGQKFMKKRIQLLIEPKKHRRGVMLFVSMLLIVLLAQGLVACTNKEVSINKAKIVEASSLEEKETLEGTGKEASSGEEKNNKDAFESPIYTDSENIDLSDVNFYLSETERDPKIEAEVVGLFFNSNEEPEFKYLYNKVDLNGDGKDEVFVLLLGTYFTGSGGSTAIILQEGADGYELVSRHTLINAPIIVSDNKTNGWNDLIVMVSGGGYPATFNKLVFDGKEYPLNPSMQPVVEVGTKVSGIGIIADEISPEVGIFYPEN